MPRIEQEVLAILDEHYPENLPPSRTAEVFYLDSTLIVGELESPELPHTNVVKIDTSSEPSFTPQA